MGGWKILLENIAHVLVKIFCEYAKYCLLCTSVILHCTGQIDVLKFRNIIVYYFIYSFYVNVY